MSDNRYSNSISIFDIIFKLIKVTILTLVIIIVLGAMIVGGMVASVLDESPEIDPTTMISSLTQTSTIYDSQGNLLEKVQNPNYEYRTIVTLDRMPSHLIDAFISIEDERFLTHPGVDILGIGASIMDAARSGGSMRGASTITQQLVRNMYLSPDRSLVRKLNEAYLSLQVEEQLSKSQILEAYLNKIYLGQGAYGVQEAAQTYFNKDVEDLTLAESALFAGIVKSTSTYQPFMRIEPGKYNSEEMSLVGTADVLGQTMYLIYNPESVSRQKIVLSQMKKLEKISEEQYQQALKEDIMAALSPGEKIYHSMT
ncbi:MAG: transglycosylase domain-containing protein, partial [Neofamilia sp.]